MAKAIASLSGGLDSILATKLILEQDIEVEAVNFLTVFCTCTSRGKTCLASKSAADKLGIGLKVFEVSKEYFHVVKNPKYGYGSNLNPCLDCRIFMFKKLGEYMKEAGASFLITGEVLGQRPMSQRRDAMRLIERESGLEGLILRPLSAKLFRPTIPEKQGIVNREKLLAIEGRSRKPQMQLAKDMSINDYPCPAGGCLLTDPGFANRMRDLLRYKPEFTFNDIQLLKIGRHFRLSPEAKLIVGRNKEENDRLLKLAQPEDLYFRPAKVKGPIGVGKGIFNTTQIFITSRIMTRYSDGQASQTLEIEYKQNSVNTVKYIKGQSLNEEELSKLRIQ